VGKMSELAIQIQDEANEECQFFQGLLRNCYHDGENDDCGLSPPMSIRFHSNEIAEEWLANPVGQDILGALLLNAKELQEQKLFSIEALLTSANRNHRVLGKCLAVLQNIETD